jgi:hypothetical protein
MYDDNDRKNQRRNSLKKKNSKNQDDFIEHRDKAKIKKALKSKLEQIKEEELWDDWENEIP